MTYNQITEDMKAALKNGDKLRKQVLSNLMAATKKAAIDNKIRDNIPDSLVDEVILKEKKTLQEMLDGCPAERNDLYLEYSNQMAIITEYAPKLLTNEEEIKAYMKEVMAGLEDISMKNVMPLLKGKVDMKIANKCYKDIIGG